MSRKDTREVLNKLSFLSYKVDLLLKLMGTHMGKEVQTIIDDSIEKYKEIKNVKSE